MFINSSVKWTFELFLPLVWIFCNKYEHTTLCVPIFRICLKVELLGHVVIPIWSFQIYIYIYIVDLQCCVNFCWAAKWLTYVLRSVVQPCPMLHLHGLCSPPSSSSVHGILQARILEWVAVSFSRGSYWPRDWICVVLQADSLLVSHDGFSISAFTLHLIFALLCLLLNLG